MLPSSSPLACGGRSGAFACETRKTRVKHAFPQVVSFQSFPAAPQSLASSRRRSALPGFPFGRPSVFFTMRSFSLLPCFLLFTVAPRPSTKRARAPDAKRRHAPRVALRDTWHSRRRQLKRRGRRPALPPRETKTADTRRARSSSPERSRQDVGTERKRGGPPAAIAALKSLQIERNSFASPGAERLTALKRSQRGVKPRPSSPPASERRRQMKRLLFVPLAAWADRHPCGDGRRERRFCAPCYCTSTPTGSAAAKLLVAWEDADLGVRV